jgi:hypothetical protein
MSSSDGGNISGEEYNAMGCEKAEASGARSCRVRALCGVYR